MPGDEHANATHPIMMIEYLNDKGESVSCYITIALDTFRAGMLEARAREPHLGVSRGRERFLLRFLAAWPEDAGIAGRSARN